jgi:hypothetical protein
VVAGIFLMRKNLLVFVFVFVLHREFFRQIMSDKWRTTNPKVDVKIDVHHYDQTPRVKFELGPSQNPPAYYLLN